MFRILPPDGPIYAEYNPAAAGEKSQPRSSQRAAILRRVHVLKNDAKATVGRNKRSALRRSVAAAEL
jgi:hypothetical protein